MIDLNDIRELPVPEEWIAAYMDGMLDAPTCSFVESNLIDSPEHADFVESLKETWNMPDNSMIDFGNSEMSMTEKSAIDGMELPLVHSEDPFNGCYNAFNDVAFTDATNLPATYSPYGDDVIQDDMTAWEALDGKNAFFSHGGDIFSDDNQSLDIDNSDSMDGLSDDIEH